MATSVVSLLTFPSTSNAFTLLRPTVVDYEDSGSASPPRKIARLAGDSDSPSASRSRLVTANNATANSSAGGPLRITVVEQPAPLSEDCIIAQSAKIKRAVQTILSTSKYPIEFSNEAIYQACRSVVSLSAGHGVFETVKWEVKECVCKVEIALLANISEGVEWVASLVQTCDWFNRQIGILSSILTYLDRAYLLEKDDLPSIRDLAFKCFRERVFCNPRIRDKLVKGIQAWITWERTERREHLLRPTIISLISHLQLHDMYSFAFESPLLECTSSYYTAESIKLATSLRDKPREFLHHCRARVEEEQSRGFHAFPMESRVVVVEATRTALLDDRLEWLTKEGVAPLMDSKDITSLADMYKLFTHVNGLKQLCLAFSVHVQATVQNIVKDMAHDEDMVQRLLEFKSFIDSTISVAFADEIKISPVAPPVTAPASPVKGKGKSGPSASSSSAMAVPTLASNKEFTYAAIDAFQRGFKARRNKPAEMIAKFVDKAMRQGQKGASDEEFARLLDAALALYRFTDDKDVFRTFYHRALAKRLLLQRSASDDFEKAVLKKLKEQYDPEFGMGDHMFNDLSLSREQITEFHNKGIGQGTAHKLNVMVLQRSFWPFASKQKDSIDLPKWMQADLSKFGDFYKQKHQGHKLDWDHSLGTVTLRGRFALGEKELSVSLYQAVVLLLFNEEEEIPFAEIKEQTRMDDGELRRTLQSLACANKKVLKKRPVGKDVHDGDLFVFNNEFTDTRAKVHINSIQTKETPEESKRAQVSIEGDRKHYLDAAIVRIMKAKKQMYYEQLKTATIDAVKSHFVPDVASIKKRIESLLEQEYLRRDEDDQNLYIYVA